MFVKSDYKAIRVNFDDILFVEGVKDYVKFHMKNKRNIITLMNLRQLEDHLPKRKFKRIHRSYIANFDLFDYTEIGIPISETYKNIVVDFIDRHTLD